MDEWEWRNIVKQFEWHKLDKRIIHLLIYIYPCLYSLYSKSYVLASSSGCRIHNTPQYINKVVFNVCVDRMSQPQAVKVTTTLTTTSFVRWIMSILCHNVIYILSVIFPSTSPRVGRWTLSSRSERGRRQRGSLFNDLQTPEMCDTMWHNVSVWCLNVCGCWWLWYMWGVWAVNDVRSMFSSAVMCFIRTYLVNSLNLEWQTTLLEWFHFQFVTVQSFISSS